MKFMVSGAALVVSLVLAVPALAVSGQCSMTGFSNFDCDVDTDGGGLTFALPSGATFTFAVTTPETGLGYSIAADAAPGERPTELGAFGAVESEPGCWQSDRDETKFCVLVAE